MLLAGLRRHHGFADAETTIGQQWRDFHGSSLATGGAPAAYGVMCGADEDGFEYMCAIEVNAFEGLEEGIGRMRVREQLYAIFRHAGGVETVRDAWLGIWNDWLPRSSYVGAPVPEFERYAADAGTGVIEIWAAVSPRRDVTA